MSEISIKMSVSETATFISKILLLIEEKNFKELSEMFESNFKNWSEFTMVALLRCSFVWRNYIPNWENGYINIEKELTVRKLNSKEILQGLDRK